MIICTSICANYLPKAMELVRSAKENISHVKVVVCLLEREVHPVAKEFEYFDHVVLAKDLGFNNFDGFIFQHSIVEAATSVKAQLFEYLLKEFTDENKFVYLDPDISVLGSFDELSDVLDSNAVVLTPHLCEPEDVIDAVMDNELCALQHGVFNLGFLAIRRDSESERFIRWWNSRLKMFCYDDIPRGIFTDQKWMDLSPCFFDIYVLKHPGYNIAPWNVSRRQVSIDQFGNYSVNGQPLRFFHFSGFDSGANEAMINKYVPDKTNPVYDLRDKYVNQLIAMGQHKLGKERWSYDYFTSGEKIKKESRVIFRNNPDLLNKFNNPFLKSNAELLRYKESSIIQRKKLVNILKKVIKKVYN